MFEIAIAIVFFTALVTVLSAMVLLARHWLVAHGNASININGEMVVAGQLGDSLFHALEGGGVHLPSSCGGVGTCGLCRVRVSGDCRVPVRAVERATLGQKAIADGERLSCQLPLKCDLRLSIPADLLGAANWGCKVVSVKMLSPLIKEITLSLPNGDGETARAFRPGQYVLVNAPAHKIAFGEMDAGPYAGEWKKSGITKLASESKTAETRAYSLVNRPGEDGIIKLNIRLALPPPAATGAVPGVVSSYLFSLKVGDRVDASGPYGDFFIREGDCEIILIGGGVGMAPLSAHVFDQLQHRASTRKISYWYGARTSDDIYYGDEMRELAAGHDNFSFHPAISEPGKDGDWHGYTGFIHSVVDEHYLKDHPNPGGCDYYLCGPPLMMHAVKSMLARYGVSDDRIFFDDFGA